MDTRKNPFLTLGSLSGKALESPSPLRKGTSRNSDRRLRIEVPTIKDADRLDFWIQLRLGASGRGLRAVPSRPVGRTYTARRQPPVRRAAPGRRDRRRGGDVTACGSRSPLRPLALTRPGARCERPPPHPGPRAPRPPAPQEPPPPAAPDNMTMDSHIGLDYIVENPEYTAKLAAVLSSVAVREGISKEARSLKRTFGGLTLREQWRVKVAATVPSSAATTTSAATAISSATAQPPRQSQALQPPPSPSPSPSPPPPLPPPSSATITTSTATAISSATAPTSATVRSTTTVTITVTVAAAAAAAAATVARRQLALELLLCAAVAQPLRSLTSGIPARWAPPLKSVN
ncbi:Protein of unknown function [Gryllus bimaculatus]|nr:Protein of unknown function [Gryllus bimaculatus]